jgi:hypothetical protein
MNNKPCDGTCENRGIPLFRKALSFAFIDKDFWKREF